MLIKHIEMKQSDAWYFHIVRCANWIRIRFYLSIVFSLALRLASICASIAWSLTETENDNSFLCSKNETFFFSISFTWNLFSIWGIGRMIRCKLNRTKKRQKINVATRPKKEFRRDNCFRSSDSILVAVVAAAVVNCSLSKQVANENLHKSQVLLTH